MSKRKQTRSDAKRTKQKLDRALAERIKRASDWSRVLADIKKKERL